MAKRTSESWLFLVLIIGVGVVVIFMTLPYLNTIALAAIMAYLFSGLFDWLIRLGSNRTVAAALVTLIVLVTILVPFSIAGYQIALEAGDLYTTLRDQASGQHVSALLQDIQNATRSYLPAASLDAQALSDRLQQILSWVVGNLGTVFTGVTRVVLNFFFFLLFFYYLTKDGAVLKRKLVALSPLSDEHDRSITHHLEATISGTIRGQLVLSLLQGIVAGCGFALFSVPNPVLWGSIVVLSSFIPVVGTSLVLVPSVLYLAAIGQWTSAVGLALWGLIAVGLLDNALGPKLLSRGTHLHPLVTMIAVLGGIGMFGPVGILMGPILVSAFLSLLTLYATL